VRKVEDAESLGLAIQGGDAAPESEMECRQVTGLGGADWV
jgi:hypothetical protein